MKIYVVGSNHKEARYLAHMVESLIPYKMVGSSGDVAVALREIISNEVDIMILTQPGQYSLVRAVRSTLPGITAIMVSEDGEKAKVSGAYLSGVDFVMKAPVHSCEIRSVLRYFSEKMTLAKQLKQLHRVYDKAVCLR